MTRKRVMEVLLSHFLPFNEASSPETQPLSLLIPLGLRGAPFLGLNGIQRAYFWPLGRCPFLSRRS